MKTFLLAFACLCLSPSAFGAILVTLTPIGSTSTGTILVTISGTSPVAADSLQFVTGPSFSGYGARAISGSVGDVYTTGT